MPRSKVSPDCSLHLLQVPQEFYNKLTPGFQQWWKIKADHFDSVIMFKVGEVHVISKSLKQCLLGRKVL
jgi:DNA mismatch repair protein MSH6